MTDPSSTTPQPTFREMVRIGALELSFESGELARQASGAVSVACGDALLFATVVADRRPTRLDYMPLTTEFRLRFSSAGRIPGSYDRREARPSEQEILTSRLIDRSVRPFFPPKWRYDTQLMIQPLSHDPEVEMGALGITAGAAALAVSDIPWGGPVAGVRVARIDGTLELFPTAGRMSKADLDLVVTVGHDGIVMVEGGGQEIEEQVVVDALTLAREGAQPLLGLLDRLRATAPAQRELVASEEDAELRARVRDTAAAPLASAIEVSDKLERYRAIDAATEAALSELTAGADETETGAVRAATASMLADLKKELIRAGVMAGKRIGGRGSSDIRAISGRTGWLARCHGSSLFTRGETQAIVTCTLGTERDAKTHDTLGGKEVDRFLLHYNFPSYSVGEARPIRGPGRREIGHGHLARRALLPVLPDQKKAPYTIRIESLITESNGSSSMATVCGGTLAMQDAGMPLTRPVAGIAMGLVKEGERFVVLSDILGDEDHVGDMDFKVCGTEVGVTAIQLDNKIGALPDVVMKQALEQARAGRLHILERMREILPATREEISPHAPRVEALQIEPYRIGELVGPGGRNIKSIEGDLGVKVEIAQTGHVRIFGSGKDTMVKARARVIDVTGIPHIGETYEGTVVSVKPFGSFVRLFEGIDGLLSDMQLKPNQRIKVCVEGVNRRGKLVLKTVA